MSAKKRLKAGSTRWLAVAIEHWSLLCALSLRSRLINLTNSKFCKRPKTQLSINSKCSRYLSKTSSSLEPPRSKILYNGKQLRRSINCANQVLKCGFALVISLKPHWVLQWHVNSTIKTAITSVTLQLQRLRRLETVFIKASRWLNRTKTHSTW